MLQFAMNNWEIPPLFPLGITPAWPFIFCRPLTGSPFLAPNAAMLALASAAQIADQIGNEKHDNQKYNPALHSHCQTTALPMATTTHDAPQASARP